MYHDKVIEALLMGIQQFHKAQSVYTDPEDKSEDLDVQLHYCEEAIIRTYLTNVIKVAEEQGIDLADVHGDDEYISLLKEEPGKHIFQKAS